MRSARAQRRPQTPRLLRLLRVLGPLQVRVKLVAEVFAGPLGPFRVWQWGLDPPNYHLPCTPASLFKQPFAHFQQKNLKFYNIIYIMI
jgi:hypothetical protein